MLVPAGVVSALLISVSYSVTINPLTTEDEAKEMAVSLATIFNGLSLMFSLTVVVVSVIYIIEIDNCTTDRDLRDFINNNGRVRAAVWRSAAQNDKPERVHFLRQAAALHACRCTWHTVCRPAAVEWGGM